MDILQQQVKRALRQLFLQRLLWRITWGCSLCLLLAAVLLGIDRFFGLIGLSLATWLISGFCVGLVASAVWTWVTRPRLLEAAWELDHRFDLRERISSALSLSERDLQSPAGQALLDDAVKRVKKLDVNERFPIQFRPAHLLPLAPVVLAILLNLIPQPVGSPNELEAKTTKSLTDSEKEELKKTRVELAKRMKEAEKKGLKEAKKTFEKLEEELRKLEKDSDKRERTETLVKLNEFAKEIEARKNKLGSSAKMKEKLNRLKQLGDGPAKKLAKALQKGDFKQAAQELQKLQQQMKNDELSQDQQAKLEKQLNELKEKINQLAEQQEQAKQNLQEQLDQARQTGQQQQAQQMLEQLQQLSQTDPQMQQMQQLADQLQQAAQQMQNGQKQAASEAMQQAQDAMQQMAQQADEMQMMQEALDRLEQAKCQMCQGGGDGMGQGKKKPGFGQGKQPGQGQGPGKRMAQGNGGKGQGDGLGEGQGEGFRPEEEVDTKTVDSFVKPEVGQGSAVIVGYEDGPNIAGEVAEEIKSTIEAARNAEADPTTQQTLPRRYQDHVKQYMRNLREAE